MWFHYYFVIILVFNSAFALSCQIAWIHFSKIFNDFLALCETVKEKKSIITNTTKQQQQKNKKTKQFENSILYKRRKYTVARSTAISQYAVMPVRRLSVLVGLLVGIKPS